LYFWYQDTIPLEQQVFKEQLDDNPYQGCNNFESDINLLIFTKHCCHSFIGHAYLHNLKNSIWATYDRGSDANSVDVQPYVTYSNSTKYEEGREKRSPEQTRQLREDQV